LVPTFVGALLCVQAVQGWQAKLESVEPDVQHVMADEREETALRKAEMEANKASVRLLMDAEGQLNLLLCLPSLPHIACAY
jgi:hypothetical protein